MQGKRTKHKDIGFTNLFCIAILCVLVLGLFMGFILAVMSIYKGYIGALQCFTVAFTPIGTVLGVAITAAFGKSKAENVIKLTNAMNSAPDVSADTSTYETEEPTI